MIPSNRSFDGKSYYEYDGKTFFRWHKIEQKGKYNLTFRFLSTDSPNKQGIALFFSDFVGKIMMCDQVLPIPKGTFKHYVFEEGCTPENTVTLNVECESGYIFFGNASEREGIGGFTSGAFGSAFWLERISTNVLRFHCNDHEYDDDFDDLVFDMELTV